MKNLFVALALSFASFNAFASDTVAGSGNVGASRVLDWDTNATLEAVAANPADFAELTAQGRFIYEVKIEVLPAESADYSTITRYTLTSSERGSILGSPRQLKKFRLVLESFFDRRIMDDTPTIWRSSGVNEVEQ